MVSSEGVGGVGGFEGYVGGTVDSPGAVGGVGGSVSGGDDEVGKVSSVENAFIKIYGWFNINNPFTGYVRLPRSFLI